jgi:hypothetical protein
MNPDSICYLYEEILRVKYAAYPNPEKKNYILTTKIEKLNKELKNMYADKYFKKKIRNINIGLRKYCAY